MYAPFGAPFGTGRPRAARTGDRRDDGHTGILNLSLRLPLRALVPAGPDFVDLVQVAQGPQPAALPVARVDCAPAQTQPLAEVRGSRKRRRSSVVLYTRPVVGSSQGVKLDDHDDMPRSRPKSRWAEWKWTDAQADGSFLGLTRSAGGVHSTPLPVGLLRRLEKLCVTSGPPSTWQVHIRTAGLRLRLWTPSLSNLKRGPSSLRLRGQKPTQTQGTPTQTWSPSLTLAPA